MTRIMKFSALAASCVIAAGASAQDVLYTGPVKQIRPVYAQKVLAMHKTATGYKIDRLGEKIDMTGEVRPTSVVTAPAYDGLEFDPALIGSSMSPTDNPAYGGPCTGVATGSRFFSGATIFDGGYMGEINSIPGTAGKFCNRLGFEWFVVTTATYAQATLAWTSDNFVDGPSATNPNDSTVRGDLGTTWLITWSGTTAGNAYLGDVDFGPGTNGWATPADGRGALAIVNGDYDSATDSFYVGNSQQMRWVIKTGNPTPADYGFCWRDRLQFNGAWDGLWNSGTDEFESRASTACNSNNPVIIKLGRVSGVACTSICASLLYAPPAVVTPTAFNVGLGAVASGNLASLGADDGNALKVCKAFVPNFTSPRIRVDMDFVSPNLAPSSIQLDTKARMTTGGSFKIRGFLADVSGTDTYVYGATNQVIADTSIALAFATYSSGAVSPTNHIDTDIDTVADGTVRARFEIQQTGFSAVAVPCAEWEYATLTVNP